MFKKTLAAAAILAAFGGAACAADVQIYGRIDLGLQYTHVDQDVQGQDATDSLTMGSGNYTGNRLGLTGSEDLGNGWSVKFVLENGFKADSGELKTAGTIFDREATLHLVSDKFGTLAFGRVAQLEMDAGSFGVGGTFSPFGTGLGDIGNMNMLWGSDVAPRWDNMVTYRTPSFGGFQVTGQYSFGANNTKDDAGYTHEEGKATTDRYYGLAATYELGGLNLAAVVDSVNNQSGPADKLRYDNVKDMVRVVVGGNYDFGFVKPYVAAAYVKNGQLNDFGSGYESLATANKGYWDTWSVSLGATAPLFGGTLQAAVGYMDGSSDTAKVSTDTAFDRDITRWMVGLGYSYNLSKRTVVYGGAGYMQDKLDMDDGKGDTKPNQTEVVFGMAHYF